MLAREKVDIPPARFAPTVPEARKAAARDGAVQPEGVRVADEPFDIAVVGAGAAGLTAALAFAREGFDTALVGPVGARRDGRTVALLGGSVRFLKALGVWDAVAPDAAPLETMRIVDDTGSLFRPPPAAFRAGEIGLDAFGWNIENATLVDRLAAGARRGGGLLTSSKARSRAARFDGTPPPLRSPTDRSSPRPRRRGRRAQLQAAPDRRHRDPDLVLPAIRA